MNHELKMRLLNAAIDADAITQPDLAAVLSDAIKEIDRLHVYEQVFKHLAQMDTSFDKNSEPRQIKAVFKISTETGPVMHESVSRVLGDFVANAEKRS